MNRNDGVFPVAEIRGSTAPLPRGHSADPSLDSLLTKTETIFEAMEAKASNINVYIRFSWIR